MINIEGKSYRLDLKKISDFVNYSDSHASKESEIIDVYEIDDEQKENGLDAVSKSIREVTTQGNVQLDSIRYDLVKTLLTQVIGFGYGETEDVSNVPFGLEIVLNTLIKEGFLIEIK